MTKQCDELRDLLSGYRDGELSAEDAYRVAGHLAECHECATALTTDSEIEEVVSESVVPRTSGEWDALTMGIQRALKKEANQRQRNVERLEARELQRRRWRRFVAGLTAKRLAFGGVGTIAIAALVFLLQPWRADLVSDLEMPSAGVPPEATRHLRPLDTIEEDVVSTPAVEEALRSLERRPAGRTEELAVVTQGRLVMDEPAKVEIRERPSEPKAEPKKERGDTKASEKPRANRLSPRAAAPSAPSAADTMAKRSHAGSTGFVSREIELEPAPVEMTEPVEVVVTAPPPGSTGMRLKTDGPSFAPTPPTNGAHSIDEVRFWLGAPAGGAGTAETGLSPAATVERALSRANALVSQGARDQGRAGLVLLTGDFDGNVARERAWTALLSLDADTAFRTRKPDVILPIALSMDAFLETYPQHENAESIREQQVRVWARLATEDPTYCAAALRRAKAWEATLGSWLPFETRMVVARMRDGPCSE